MKKNTLLVVITILLVSLVSNAQIVSLKHHTSNTIVNNNTISCTANFNTFYRSFNLSQDFNITEPFNVSEVSFAIDPRMNPPFFQTIRIKIYGADSFPGQLTEKAFVDTQIVSSDAGTIVSVPITAIVTEDILVFSITVAETSILKVGSNSEAQTAPSYLSYVGCNGGSNGILNYTDINFDVSLIMEVKGTVGTSPNDVCDTASTLQVGGNETEFPINNIDHTIATDSGVATPSCGNYQDRDVWYAVTVPDDGIVTVETFGASNTAMAIYSGACTNLTQIQCDNDSGDNSNAKIVINDMALAGQTLYVRVWGANNSDVLYDIAAYNPALLMPATALHFDGSTLTDYDYLEVADDNSLDFTTAFTFEAWVNFDTIDSSVAGLDWQGLFGKSTFGGAYGLMLRTASGQEKIFRFYHPGFGTGSTDYSWDQDANRTLSTNTWYHIAVTLSSTAINIYINGDNVKNVSLSGTPTLSTNTNPLIIGAGSLGSNFPYPFNGIMDEVRFWNVARTQTEINDNKDYQLAGNELGLVLNYRFDQGIANADNTTITAVTDNSSYNNDATLNSFSLTGAISNFTSGYSILSREVLLNAKVYLQGAALQPNTGEESLMRDDLREAGLLPTTSPYTDGLTCIASVFNTTGTDAIIDWVWVELRDATDNTSVIAAQSALLQRDGDIVSVDGSTGVGFNVDSRNYYIALKHRNHLGIMSANTFALNSSETTVDFTDGSIVTFGSNAQTSAGMPSGTMAMWAGNVNDDAVVQYSGTSPDTPNILSLVLNDPGNFLNFPTFTVSSYNNNDVNMDGSTQYSGTNPDSPVILQNVLAHPGNFLNFSTYQITNQLPEN